MLNMIFCSVLIAHLMTSHIVLAVDYGVGFSLLLDYGTASVYFSNGTSVDIAKIEGSPAYRQMMRTTEVDHYNSVPHRTILAAKEAPTNVASQEKYSLQYLLDLLPPWLGGHDILHQPLTRMLGALKTATESYLESPLSDVEVVLPFPATDSFVDTIRSACSLLSLSMPLSAQPPAGILAARVYGLDGQCSVAGPAKPSDPKEDDPEQLILTVDYSRAALTALLAFEECGVFELRRVWHDTRIGADGLSGGIVKNRLEEIVQVLRNITSLPLQDGNGAGLVQISNLVLLGESAEDSLLHDALVRVLEESSSRPLAAAGEKPMRVIDPLFAASRGLAFDCWDRLTSGDNKANENEL